MPVERSHPEAYISIHLHIEHIYREHHEDGIPALGRIELRALTEIKDEKAPGLQVTVRNITFQSWKRCYR